MELAFKDKKGITLIELMIVLVIGSFIAAGAYRTFAGQQKTYTVQDQIVDIQQNARASIQRMVREVRLAGFGNVLMVLPATINSVTYNNVVNPDTPAAGSLTILSAIVGAGALTAQGNFGKNQITVSRLNDDQGSPLFDTSNRKYVSIGGVESHEISSIDNGTKTITLKDTLIFKHSAGTSVFAIRALTYQVVVVSGTPLLMRDDNSGSGAQPLSDNIEALQLMYTLVDDSQTGSPAKPADIRMVRVSVTARAEKADPDLKAGDGYRRRQFATNIHLKNLGIEP